MTFNINQFTEKINSKWVIVFLVIFYSVGIIGTSLPISQSLFITLVPVALLLSTIILFSFHEKYTPKVFFIFGIVYFLGLIVEIIGVNTGIIFGNYEYGNSLGAKILDTPLIIGVNWLMLTYCLSTVFANFIHSKIVVVLVSSSIMVIYDIVLEQVAPQLDMWHWNNGIIPTQNYVAWFVVSMLLTTILVYSKVELKNKLSLSMIVIQMIYFMVLYFTL